MHPDVPTNPDLPEASPAARRGGRLGTVLVAVMGLLLLALFAVTVLGRTIRGPGPVLLVATTLLPFLYAAYGVAAFGLWCVVPDRRTLPVFLTLAALGAGILWGPSFPARPETSEGLPLTVASWNVQRLWGGEEGTDAAACVIDELRSIDPDVLTLLEVSADNVDRLSAELDLDCVHTDYFGTGRTDRGGLAVCVASERLRLSGRALRFSDEDSWRYVAVEVDAGVRPFNVLGVHLQPYWPLTGAVMRDSVTVLAQGETGPILDVTRDSTEVVARQGAQSVALLDRVSRYTDPTIVAGDFNSTRDSALHATLRRSFVDTWARGGQGFGATVHALGWLPLRVDYIYATPDFAVGGSRLGPSRCADHRPVVSSLVLRADER